MGLTYRYVHTDGRTGYAEDTYLAMVRALGAYEANYVLEQTESRQFYWREDDTAELCSKYAGEQVFGTFTRAYVTPDA